MRRCQTLWLQKIFSCGRRPAWLTVTRHWSSWSSSCGCACPRRCRLDSFRKHIYTQIHHSCLLWTLHPYRRRLHVVFVRHNRIMSDHPRRDQRVRGSCCLARSYGLGICPSSYYAAVALFGGGWICATFRRAGNSMLHLLFCPRACTAGLQHTILALIPPHLLTNTAVCFSHNERLRALLCV